MRLTFFPTQVKYYDYFEEASGNLLEAARQLQQLLEHYDNVQEKVAAITELEHQGDFIVHNVTNNLPRTMITPIDMEDIVRLISAEDDAMDALEEAAKRLVIFQISEVKEPALRLSRLIVEAATELQRAVHDMRDKRHYDRVHEYVVRVNTVEDNADLVLDEAISDMVKHVKHREDIFDFIRWKEIFELLEATTDRIEDAGDIIQRVIITNA